MDGATVTKANMHLGIDYGAKLAGTTAICFEQSGQLHIRQSDKKRDADKFIQQAITQLQPKSIFIDAPLSLPLAYFGKGDNYFYRDCDKLLKGMSPMFLGGLTARAMKLANTYEKTGISFLETYPAQIVKHYLVEITEGYKQQKEFLANFCEILVEQFPYHFAVIPSNWHQVDSALAWWAGWRYKNGKVKIYGNEEEGVIYI